MFLALMTVCGSGRRSLKCGCGMFMLTWGGQVCEEFNMMSGGERSIFAADRGNYAKRCIKGALGKDGKKESVDPGGRPSVWV